MRKDTDFRIIDITIVDLNEKLAAEQPQYDPRFLYIKVRAVSAGEYYGPNNNGDYFPEEELKKSYKTFLTNAKVFKNHQNKKVEDAIGDVVEAIWNDEMKYVELLIRVNKEVASSICKNLEAGVITDVSMGCRVKYSICSICGNKARKPSEFCDHVSKAKGLRNKIMPDGRRAYEINIGPSFHDISIVLKGAAPTEKVLEKIASLADTPPIIDERICLWAKQAKLFLDKEKTPLYKYAKKERALNKLAEIEKEIKGLISDIAIAESVDEAMNKMSNHPAVNLIRALYTPSWDEQKCEQIAESVKNIAKETGNSLDDTIDMFLKVLNFLKIDVSPVELDRVFSYLSEAPQSMHAERNAIFDVFSKIKPINIQTAENMIDDEMVNPKDVLIAYKRFSDPSIGFQNIFRNLPIGSVIKSVVEPSDIVDLKPNPLAVNKIVIMLKGDLPDKSMLSTFLVPKLLRILGGLQTPLKDRSFEFVPIGWRRKIFSSKADLPIALSDMAYHAYKYAHMDFDTMQKYASMYEDLLLNQDILEKQAAKPQYYVRRPTRLLLGLPAALGLSEYIEQRDLRGEKTNPVVKAMAKHPIVPMMFIYSDKFGGKVFEFGNRFIRGTGSGIKSGFKNVAKIFKKAAFLDDADLFDLQKDAEAYNFAFFTPDFDQAFMAKEAMDKKELDQLKQKMCLAYAGVEEIDKKNQEKIAKYIQYGVQYIREDLEKTAANVKEILIDIAHDLSLPYYRGKKIDTTAGRVLGSTIDGLVINKLFEALNRVSQSVK